MTENRLALTARLKAQLKQAADSNSWATHAEINRIKSTYKQNTDKSL